jgi:hypothetical protein
MRNKMADPRAESGFRPDLFPLCEGRAVPSFETSDAITRRKLDYLLVYYEINLRYQQLLAARQSPAGEAERTALQAIEQALLARDALEDQHARFGVIACPVIENGIIVNLKFAAPPSRSQSFSSMTMTFNLPVPWLNEKMDPAQ